MSGMKRPSRLFKREPSTGNKHDLHFAENIEYALYPYGMKIFLTSKTAFSILT